MTAKLDGPYVVMSHPIPDAVMLAVQNAVDASLESILESITDDVANDGTALRRMEKAAQHRLDQPETAAVILGLAFMFAVGSRTGLHWWFQCEGTRWQGTPPEPVKLLHQVLGEQLAEAKKAA